MNVDGRRGQESEDEGMKPLRIMLLGKSGVGKSSSGNTIFGRLEFKSDLKVVRVTRHCEKGVGIVKDVRVDETGKVEDVPVAVIDTPGFFEPERKEEIVRDILKCVKLQEPGPHAFVFVVPVGRMTQEDLDTQTLIEEKFGPRVWHYTIVLFTHGDRLKGKNINDVIAESDEHFRNFIRKCSGGFHVFDNTDPQDMLQVTTLIEKLITLRALNGGGHYHTGLYPEKERKIRERQESILAERDAEISRKERELMELYQGEDLEEALKRLWKTQEESSRVIAEKETKKVYDSRNIWRKLLLMIGVVILAMILAAIGEGKGNAKALNPRGPRPK